MIGIPEEFGFYFAKLEHGNCFNLIVRVEGGAPMLYISYALDIGINGPRIIAIKPFQINEWGSKIEEPEEKYLKRPSP